MLLRVSSGRGGRDARPRTLALIAALAGAALAPVMVWAQETSAASQDAPSLAEVTVTAQKRAQPLQEVPMSITALDTRQLESLGAVNFEDFARVMPGLEFSNLGPGQNRITIRGVSTFSGVSVVGLYLDDSPVASTINYSQPNLALFDVDRVELLRGPQGTLYGEGSLGGTLRYITAEPDATGFHSAADASVSQTQHGGTNYDLNGMINAPLVDDKLAVRLVGLHHDDAGYIDSIPLHESNFNDVKTDAGRAKVLLLATDQLSVEVSGLYQKIEQDGPNVESFDAPRGSLENLDTQPAHFNDKFTQGTLTVKYELPFAQLVSSTARFDRTTDQAEQYRGTAFAPLIDYELVGTDYKITTEELRLVSTTPSRIKWVAGAFYKKYDVNQLVQDFNNSPSGAFLDSLLQNSQYKQFALFGELEYGITEHLFGTVGLRWFKEDQEGINQSGTVFPVSANKIIPRFVLRYEVNPHAMVYASATEGFRSGGVNLFSLPGVDNTYKPDTTWNYELGTKLEVFDHQLAFNAAIYHIDWSNLQTFVARPDLGPFVFFVENASAAKVDGAELELAWRVPHIKGLELGATGAFTNARYTKDAPFEGPAGNKLPKVPRWTTSSYAEYRVPVSVGRSVYTRFDYEYYGTFPELGDNVVKSGNYTIGNLRGGLEAGPWNFELFVDNLWDTRADLFQRRSEEFGVYRNRPRTYGLDIRWRL